MPRIQLDDLDMFYQDTGSGSPVLLLHGSLSTGRVSFERLLPRLAAHHRVLCPDLRGHGHSRSEALSWTTPMIARDMLAFMTALGLERAHIVGHSMGGDIGMMMAVRAPARCRTLTSIGSGGSRNPDIQKYLEKLMAEDGSNPWPHIAREQEERHREAHRGDWRTFMVMNLASFVVYPDFSAADLRRLNMPFLLAHGSRDPFVSHGEVVRLRQCCPRFTHRVIEGAGHSPQSSATHLEKLLPMLLAHLAGSEIPA